MSCLQIFKGMPLMQIARHLKSSKYSDGTTQDIVIGMRYVLEHPRLWQITMIYLKVYVNE